jgi:hypothetical protein
VARTVGGAALAVSVAGMALLPSGTSHAELPLFHQALNASRQPSGESRSSNWSGYTLMKAQTGQSYASASAKWVVPAVSAVPGTKAGASSTWVGIGGTCLDATCKTPDTSLIQLGTSQNVGWNGSSHYFAWYELLPNAAQKITTLGVSVGDTVTASLAMTGGGPNGQTWVLSMTDTTPAGQTSSWSGTFGYTSSLASVEWIEEAPYANGTVLPLANFGTATILATSANGAAPRLGPSNAVYMLTPWGQTSNPAMVNGAAGFATCWGLAPTLAACTSPSA